MHLLGSTCLVQTSSIYCSSYYYHFVKYYYHYGTVGSNIFQIPFLLYFSVKGNIQSCGKF